MGRIYKTAKPNQTKKEKQNIINEKYFCKSANQKKMANERGGYFCFVNPTFARVKHRQPQNYTLELREGHFNCTLMYSTDNNTIPYYKKRGISTVPSSLMYSTDNNTIP